MQRLNPTRPARKRRSRPIMFSLIGRESRRDFLPMRRKPKLLASFAILVCVLSLTVHLPTFAQNSADRFPRAQFDPPQPQQPPQQGAPLHPGLRQRTETINGRTTIWGPTPIVPEDSSQPADTAQQTQGPAIPSGTFARPDLPGQSPKQLRSRRQSSSRSQRSLAIWPPPAHLREMMEDAEITDLSFVDTNTGWAVGDRGVIWHTKDGGRNWALQNSSVDCRLESVCFLDQYTGWAVGGFTVPYTHRTQGIVLRTRNGGLRWEQVDDDTLPALTKVKFQTNIRGWAIGVPSSLYPTGVFLTSDGGRNWKPLPDGQGGPWLCGDFRDARGGVVAGRDGAIAVASSQGLVKSRPLNVGLRHVRDVALVDQTGGWLVGDGGLLMGTVDGGLSWQLPEGDLPGSVIRQFDFASVAVIGPKIWVTGSPGTMIHHSPDGGRSWQPQMTGQNLPLSTVHFVDGDHGYAAGAMGTILATRDGGGTWHRQKSGGTRAAVLGIFGSEEALPLEMFAKLSGEDGLLGVAEIVGRRDIEQPHSWTAMADVRTQAALMALGGSQAKVAWQFPLRQAGLNFSAGQISKMLDQTHDGHGMQMLEDHLVKKIRQWRPDVLVTHDASPTGEPLAYVVHQMVMRAVDMAADSTSHTDQLTVARLEPWQVKKVYVRQSGDRRGEVSIATSHLTSRLGASLAEAGTKAHGLIASGFQPRPTTLEFRLLKSRGESETTKRDFFAGLNVPYGGQARRKASDPPASDFGKLQRLAKRRRHLERLLDPSIKTPWPDEAWLAQMAQLTQGLGDETAGQMLYQMGDSYARTGRAALAAECFHTLVTQYPSHALAESATWRLVGYAASTENAWQIARAQEDFEEVSDQAASQANLATAGIREGNLLNNGQPVQPANFEEPVQTLHQSNRDDLRMQRVQTLVKQLELSQPQLAIDPGVRMAVAAVLRDGETEEQARALYSQLAAISDTPWSATAAGELWLGRREGAPPRPTFACQRTSLRPRLDGSLNDNCWQKVQPLTLRSQLNDDATWPAAVMLTYDAKFLFIGVTCRIAENSVYRTEEEKRVRDADLRKHDRVEILIDTDRDYASFYRLVVDYRGWATESLLGDTTFNPQWFIANERNLSQWTAEAAIPWEQLSKRPPQAGEAWAIGLQRIVPAVGFQSWSQPASVQGEPAGFGLVVFQ